MVNGDGRWAGLAQDDYNNKWLLNWSSTYGCYKITPVRGSGPMCVMGELNAQWHDIEVKKKSDDVHYRWQFETIPELGDRYYIKEIRPRTSNIWYLKQQDGSATNVLANQDKGLLFRSGWCVTPVEDFSLKEITYSLSSGDGAVPIPSFMDEYIINNRTGTQQSMNATFSSKATTTSNFSENKGLQIQTGISVKVGIPTILEATLNTSITTTASWTYGNSESKEDSRSYNFSIIVPAYSQYRATVTVALYNATTSYKAKYRGNTTGKIIEKAGRWNGVLAGLIIYDIYNVNGTRIFTQKNSINTPIDIRQYIQN